MYVNVGIDIGSTTVKIVVVRDGEIIHKHYERHFSKVREKAVELVRAARELIGEDTPLRCSITGSAGLGVAKAADIDFVQEVFATRKAVGVHVPQADVVIELGGEDAKIVFLTGQLEERMNGSCAGGTGAFIDQMAVLLDVTPSELDELAQGAERIYTIASRCGVFAKSDIQPLLNEGARKEDVAASIFQAVVNQTIAGLAQGREVKGDVLFLGGPLFFFKGLQKRFQETLKLDDAHAHFVVAELFQALFHSFGAALNVSLDNNGQFLHIVLGHLVKQVIQGDLGVSSKLLFLGFGGTLVSQFTGQAFILNSLEDIAGGGYFSQAGDLHRGGRTGGFDFNALIVTHGTHTANGGTGNQTVALKVIHKVIVNLVLIKVVSVDEQLRVIAIFQHGFAPFRLPLPFRKS